jgi:hypothetical protein
MVLPVNADEGNTVRPTIATVGVILLLICAEIPAAAPATVAPGVDPNAPPSPPPAEPPVSPSPAFTIVSFSRNYEPGAPDAAGNLMSGTETMRLIRHKGKLFASTGVWMDLPYPPRSPGDPPWVGPQILVKDSVSAPWRVEVGFPANVRLDGMISATFVTDGAGNVLDPPVTMLIIDPACTRDDATGTWTPSAVPTSMRNSRSFCTHRDGVTGIQHLFAGDSSGRIFRGVYDSSAQGRLRWAATPELTGTGRVMCMAEADGVLYAAAGIDNDTDLFSGGLFRRVDGAAPNWELLWRWPHVIDPDGDEYEILRGLTAVRDPSGGSHQVLIGACTYPGVVYRIDPKKNFAVTTELDIKAYFAKAFGVTKYNGPALSAYNNFLPATDPDTGDPVHLFGAGVGYPKDDPALKASAWYLVRHVDGTYRHGQITDPRYPTPNPPRGLTATRTLEISPFPEDRGRVIYGGGYDCAGIESHYTAWIYKGTVLSEVAIPLAAGYTLIALPLTPQSPLTAESLAQQINAQGGACTSVIAYDSATGAFVTHPAGTALSNFDIAAGSGYFVRCATASTWRVRGFRLGSFGGSLTLKSGYNLIGLPVEPLMGAAYTAEGFGIEINDQGGGATQIVRYDETTGQFVTHPVGTALENFSLALGRGYFVRCTKDSTWAVSSVSPLEWFDRVDRNKDGKLSYEEVPSPQFKGLDTDGDGFVTLAEWKAYLNRLAIAQLDRDGDGVVSQEEFNQLYFDPDRYFSARRRDSQPADGRPLPDPLPVKADPLGLRFTRLRRPLRGQPHRLDLSRRAAAK